MLRIDGSKTLAQRRRALALFDEPDRRVLLLGLQAGGVGLNLQQAQVGVLLDSWWTDAAMVQARDRIWRLGSPHYKVFCYDFHARATVDDLLKSQRTKKERLTLLFEESLRAPADA